MPYGFHGQRSNESVVLFTRQHPLTLLRPLLVSALILLVPFALYAVMSLNGVLAAAIVISLALAFLHGGLALYGWNNTVMMLTSERVVLLHQRGLLHREFSECDLASIQQVSHKVSGIFHTLFGYGTISVYAGGSQKPFEIANVPDPYEIQQEVLSVKAGERLVEEPDPDNEPEPKEGWLE